MKFDVAEFEDDDDDDDDENGNDGGYADGDDDADDNHFQDALDFDSLELTGAAKRMLEEALVRSCVLGCMRRAASANYEE